MEKIFKERKPKVSKLNIFSFLALVMISGCSRSTPSCGGRAALRHLDEGVKQAKTTLAQRSDPGVIEKLSARFKSIRTLKHESPVDSYVCESVIEVLSDGDVRHSDQFRYEIYAVENSQHPFEIQYDGHRLTSHLAFVANMVSNERGQEAARKAAKEAMKREEDLLSSLPSDLPGVSEKIDLIAAQAPEGVGDATTKETRTNVTYLISSDRTPVGGGEPGFAKSYPEWRIDCEQQGGTLQCVSVARDHSWKRCDGSLDPGCDESKDGWIRTIVTEADLKSVLPFLTVQDTVAAVRFGYCANGICFKSGNPVGLIQPQMQEWLRNRCGAQLSAGCVE